MKRPVTVFRSKRGDRVELLYWDEDGFGLVYKRLKIGTFRATVGFIDKATDCPATKTRPSTPATLGPVQTPSCQQALGRFPADRRRAVHGVRPLRGAR